jgi:ADP-ribosylglycohydrolase
MSHSYGGRNICVRVTESWGALRGERLIRGQKKNVLNIMHGEQREGSHSKMRKRESLESFKGCLLGGAVGDALGAPIEFLSISEIRNRHGPQGISAYSPAYGRRGAITDDTQMTLFTAEGMLRANCRLLKKGICHPPSVVRCAYLRWLATQGEKSNDSQFEWATRTTGNGWLLSVKEIYARRAPGLTCVAALKGEGMGTLEEPLNDSKGCGGVMRMAPSGLIADDFDAAFQLGCELAALTHGHPTGYLAAGSLSAIIFCLRQEMTLDESVEKTMRVLKSKVGGAECVTLLELAVSLSGTGKANPETIEKIGGGWTAGEALAIAIHSSLSAKGDFRKGVLLAVNHSGDSDSTGSITGNILGTMLGERAIPAPWLEDLELKEVILKIAQDLHTGYEDTDGWWKKYPGF